MLRSTSSATGSGAVSIDGGDASRRQNSNLSSGGSGPRRNSKPHGPGRGAALSRLDLDAAFFWLLLVGLVTLVFFLNFRGSHVELNPSQVAEYERRSQVLSNSTVYIVEVHRPEGLLRRLSPEDWARVSGSIDYVAYVFDDLPVFLADEWVSRAERVLRGPSLPHAARINAGLGIVLFSCGCILPNAYFKSVAPRLGGMECLLLPGWVLPPIDVHWIPDIDQDKTCKRRKSFSASKVVAEYASQLSQIRRSLERIRADLPGVHNAGSATGVTGGMPLLASLSSGAAGSAAHGSGVSHPVLGKAPVR